MRVCGPRVRVHGPRVRMGHVCVGCVCVCLGHVCLGRVCVCARRVCMDCACVCVRLCVRGPCVRVHGPRVRVCGPRVHEPRVRASLCLGGQSLSKFSTQCLAVPVILQNLSDALSRNGLNNFGFSNCRNRGVVSAHTLPGCRGGTPLPAGA